MDKLLHCLVGLIVMFFIIAIYPKLWKDPAGILILWLVASGWEIYQGVSGEGTIELMDIIATCLLPSLYWFYTSKILK